MDDVMHYLEMGGYARFVWPAYGIAAVVLAGLWFSSRRRLKREERHLAELESALGIAGRRTDARRAADRRGAE